MASPAPLLERGFSKSFRVVRQAGPRARAEMGKWISWLPATWPAAEREAFFDELATALLTDPVLAPLCNQAKLCPRPLAQAPSAVAWMLYCPAAAAPEVLARLKPLMRAFRAREVAAGRLAARDGFLGRWEFKTDAQTRAELAAGTHPSQVSLLLELDRVFAFR